MPAEHLTYQSRRKRASEGLRARGLAALLLSPGSDLAYLAGYRVFASERLTCLVVNADGAATLVVPELEAPRAKTAAPDLSQRTWGETEDPYALVARLVTASGDVAVADQMWSLFVLRLQTALRGRGFQLASDITRGLRMRKDEYERDALRELLQQALRIKIEVARKEREGLESSLTRGGQVDVVRDYRYSVAVSDEHLYWPYDGEFWRDELGTYTYTLTKGCRDTAARAAR